MTVRTPVLHLVGDSLTDTDNITNAPDRYDAQTQANFPMFTVNSPAASYDETWGVYMRNKLAAMGVIPTALTVTGGVIPAATFAAVPFITHRLSGFLPGAVPDNMAGPLWPDVNITLTGKIDGYAVTLKRDGSGNYSIKSETGADLAAAGQIIFVPDDREPIVWGDVVFHRLGRNDAISGLLPVVKEMHVRMINWIGERTDRFIFKTITPLFTGSEDAGTPGRGRLDDFNNWLIDLLGPYKVQDVCGFYTGAGSSSYFRPNYCFTIPNPVTGPFFSINNGQMNFPSAFQIEGITPDASDAPWIARGLPPVRFHNNPSDPNDLHYNALGIHALSKLDVICAKLNGYIPA